jgi:biotin carboxyl carrier protein
MRKYQLKLNDKEFEVQLNNLSADEAQLEINGKSYVVSISSVSEVLPEGNPAGIRPVATVVNKPISRPVSADDGTVLAPIPGAILQVHVKVGEKIKVGQALFKMEAMKMENEINARLDGTVMEINIKSGDTVNQGDVLMLIE